MSECKHKRKDGVCLQDLEYVYKGFCVDGPCSCFEPQTNADRIRSMTDEELADWIAYWETRCYKRVEPLAYCDTENFAKQILDWLKSPVEEINDSHIL